MLNWEVNLAKTLFPKISSPVELPTGDLRVQFQFKPSSGLAGTGALLVDGKQIAEAPMSSGTPYFSWEGLDIGQDKRTAVTPSYIAPFAFNGDLKKVVYDLQ